MIFLLLILIPFTSFADMGASYSAGSSFAAGQQFQAKPDYVPGFAGDAPEESNLDPVSLGEAAASKMAAENSPGKMVIESEAKKPKFDVDSQLKAALEKASEVIENPESATQVEREDEEQGGEETETAHTCFYVPEIDYACTRRLVLHPSKASRKVYWRTRHYGKTFNRCGRHHGPGHDQHFNHISYDESLSTFNRDFWDGCQTYENRRVKEYKDVEYDVDEPTKDTFISDCDVLESRCDQGQCFSKNMACLEGSEERTIGDMKATRSCWAWKMIYRCSGNGEGSCGDLKKNPKCRQVNSECAEMKDGGCVKFKVTYKCTSTSPLMKKTNLKHGAFCLDGNCHQPQWDNNSDMMTALSHLSLLKDMQGEAASGQVFKGNGMMCSRHCISFSDCCSLGTGWGQSLGLTSCGEEEKLLGKLRREKKCVFVGSYCAEKALGVCLRKKNTYCCFGSKLTRLIQEQGRRQLGQGFGDAKCPDCRGLTIEEISRVNFDQLNLSEAFEDIKVKAVDVSGTTRRFSEEWRDRLPTVDWEKRLTKIEKGESLKRQREESTAQAKEAFKIPGESGEEL